jgi:hypothetical protein
MIEGNNFLMIQLLKWKQNSHSYFPILIIKSFINSDHLTKIQIDIINQAANYFLYLLKESCGCVGQEPFLPFSPTNT